VRGNGVRAPRGSGCIPWRGLGEKGNMIIYFKRARDILTIKLREL